MALTHSHVEGSRLRRAATVALIGACAAVIWGVGTLTRPMSTATSADEAAPHAASLQPGMLPSPVNIGFAQDMSLHHEQALTMANMALAKGSPRVRQIAQGIVNQQLKEIGYMQGWLMLWQAPGIAASDDMKWMRDAYAHSPHRDPAYDQFIDSCIKGQGMPGLATSEQLEALEAAASPEAFDKLFLALMVRHHQGAVVMARFASEHAELELVRGFARAIVAEQQQEMTQMLRWLKAG